jgi:ABC-type bacteriocin/lantibiotic exporter with double-glycine peptidase domain
MRAIAITPMTGLIALSAAMAKTDIKIKATKRSLMHTFAKPGPAILNTYGTGIVMVIIDDYPSGPMAVIVDLENSTKRSVAVSKAEFNKMWTIFKSSGADKYPSKAPIGPDMASYYFFSAENQLYAVPKNKASAAVVSLATQIRAYAK